MHPGVRTILEKFFEFEDQRPNTEDPEYSSKYESSGAKIIDLNLISEFLIKHGIYKDFETRENMAVVLESVDQKALQLIYMLILAAFVKEIDYMNDEKKAELIELVNRFNQQVGRDLIDSITALEQLLECEKLKRFELLQELRAIGIDVNALRPQVPPKQAPSQTRRTNRSLFPQATTSEAPPPSGLVRQAASAAEVNGYGQVAGSRRLPPKLLPKPGMETAVSEPTVVETQPALPPVNTATRDKLPETSLSNSEKHRSALLKRRSAVYGDSPQVEPAQAKTIQATARTTTDENRQPPQNGSRARSLSRSASAAERPAFFASIISGDRKASLRATATRVGINQEEAPKASEAGIAASLLGTAADFTARANKKTPPRRQQDDFEQSFTPSPT